MLRKWQPRALLLTLALVAVAAFAAAGLGAAPPSVESEIIRLTNVERQKVGAPALRANGKMTAVAAGYAGLMARLDMLGHNLDGKDGGKRLNDGGYNWASWGENIAFNYPDAASVVQGWMSDEPHKQNLLNPKFTEIGVGVARNAKGQPYYDQVFAQPAQ